MGKGWFKTEYNDGDRSITQQLVGLDALLSEVRGLQVLDVGCAEGLISFELLRHGAAGVVGVDIVKQHIQRARHAASELREATDKAEFVVGDALTYQPEPVDVVLLLAVLHKLNAPYETAVKFAKATKRLCVVRLPPGNAVFRDARSGDVPIDVTAAMREGGLELRQELLGTFGEWLGYYVRPAAKTSSDPVEITEVGDGQRSFIDEAGERSTAALHAVGSQSIAADAALVRTEPEAPAEDPAQYKREHPAHEMAPPPNSVHPGGDPAVQLPIEKIEPLPLEGHEGAERREPAAD